MTQEPKSPSVPVVGPVPGDILGDRFRIIEVMGTGGMGRVYCAEDLTLRETVALKVLRPQSEQPRNVDHVRDEVRLARQVSHRNVCRVHDIAEFGGLFVISMEFIDGEDLKSLLRRVGRLPLSAALDIGLQVAEGLAALHERDVLHLDLKPGNVMIDANGTVKITDFGQAGRSGDRVRGGTPLYMPPELYEGRAAGAASDLYSLGLVLYELVTGARPFKGSQLVIAFHHHDVVPTPPSAIADGIDPRVERMILKCLEKRPGNRPATVRTVIESLEAVRAPRLETVPELVIGEEQHALEENEAAQVTVDTSIRLRVWPTRELPDRPYPVLLPYVHPQLLAGRKLELAKLKRLLRLPQPILGFHAASGIGKSSVLLGGLLPWLRASGWPVSYNRYPWEPGALGQILSDLIDNWNPTGNEDWHDTALWLGKICRVADEIPLIIIDQFEELFHRDHVQHQRALLGALLAATCQRQPGTSNPSCRWILAYRQEYHGEVMAWLADVLADGRLEGLGGLDTLPSDLTGTERFQAMSLSPLGAALPGGDPMEVATMLFRDAIEAPLEVTRDDGTPHYPWRFAEGESEKLARAFARARLEQPHAPLVPELQVVLAYLLQTVGVPGSPGDIAVVRVPDQPDRLIEEALEEHLKRSLKAAFPPGLPTSIEGCSRALLALRELAHATGRRQEGLSEERLVRAIGPRGHALLHRLAAPDARLVVAWSTASGPTRDDEKPSRDAACVRWTLSHDRMAEAIVHVVEQEGQRGGLTVDSQLISLRRFVTLESAVHQVRGGEPGPLSRRRFKMIEDHQHALLWDEARRRWWTACRQRRRRDRRRRAVLASLGGIVMVLVALVAWRWATHRAYASALVERVSTGAPESALLALVEMLGQPEIDRSQVLDNLTAREHPADILERGLGGLPEPRGRAVLQVGEFFLPVVSQDPLQLEIIAPIIWSVDYVQARESGLEMDAARLRKRLLAPLRRIRPPPDEDLFGSWVVVPAGSFLMDRAPEEEKRPVEISAVRMLDHEVTNREYRLFDPSHQGRDELPAAFVNWYQAYAFAAWLGGRLPTEAEWEYAARANCDGVTCGRDGSNIDIDATAWTLHNSRDPETFEPGLQPVAQLEPNPWGLYDMLGNAWEWTVDWWAPIPGNAVRDPWGPVDGSGRVLRGGCFRFQARTTNPYLRISESPGNGDVGDQGFRVVLPVR